MATLYESVGRLNDALVSMRKGQSINVFAAKNNLVASLKKMQYFNFLKEELGVLPDAVEKRGTDEESVRGFERLSLAYFLISLTQLQLNKSFDFLKVPTLLYDDIIDEFTCKRDLSYYVVMILLTCGDYDTFKAKVSFSVDFLVEN